MTPMRTCRQCGKRFEPPRATHYFCSWECHQEWHSAPHDDESEIQEHTFGVTIATVLTAGELARMRAGDFRELD